MMQHLSRLAWSSRKLRLPFYGKGLVLDVGSGGNPHPFADVLLEKYIDPTHRYRAMTIDRPLVLADATAMPFKPQAFSYAITFHVLEHLHDPAGFLGELERVAAAGYIETPNALYEKLSPFDVHLLEIMLIDDTLHIHKKPGPEGDDYIGALQLLGRDPGWRRFFGRNPRYFHVCYAWDGQISFEILNPDQSTDWFTDPETAQVADAAATGDPAPKGLRPLLLKALRSLRRRDFDLDDLLACPTCHADLRRDAAHYHCTGPACGQRFAATPIPDFNNPV